MKSVRTFWRRPVHEARRNVKNGAANVSCAHGRRMNFHVSGRGLPHVGSGMCVDFSTDIMEDV